MVINEIFTSLDGEINGFHQGRVSTFLRLQGCNLRCKYCDTPQALKKYTDSDKYKSRTVGWVVKELLSFETKKITITGGEPLMFAYELYSLIERLTKQDKFISVETNGSLPVRPIIGVSYIMDYKLPSSGESEAMNLDNFYSLGPGDFVKFIIADFDDYIVALGVMDQIRSFNDNVQFAMSPMFKGKGNGGDHNGDWLANIMIDDRLDAIFNLQIHKVIGFK